MTHAPRHLPRVFLTRAEGNGWALDEDRRLTRDAIEPLVRLVDNPRDADIIHAPWWQPLLELPRESLAGRHVLCHLVGDLARCLGEPAFTAALDRATTWIAHSRSALADLPTITTSAALVPYAVDVDALTRAVATPPTPRIADALARIPTGSYVIASAQRDTEGHSLRKDSTTPEPKLVKGPDVLIEIVAAARDLGVPAVLLLAGPRRHWIRRACRERYIPFIFVGPESPHDDFDDPRVRLTSDEIAHLLARADLHITASRSEGGPRGILEAAALSVPQLSTPVGHARDILHPACIFTDPIAAAETITRDFRNHHLRAFAPAALATVRAAHTVESVRAAWADVYARIAPTTPRTMQPFALAPALPRIDATPRTPIRIWFRYKEAPWGGGNQFHHALRAEFLRRGLTVLNNEEGASDASAPCAHLIDSVQFDTELFQKTVRPTIDRVVHRFDGPVSMIRRTEDSLTVDRDILAINDRFASATVIQSMFQLRQWASIGLAPRRMCMIPNASDPDIFFPESSDAAITRDASLRDRPLKVVASSWSPNPGKGAATYAWLDANLDPARFTFTFVGRLPVKLTGGGSRHIDAVDSRALADELRSADVYLTASRWDPCSNALIEALSAGLPALYINDGGHPELTGFAGLPFDMPWEVPALLERIRAWRPTYRRLARPLPIRAAADRYLELLLGSAPYR